MKNASRLIGAAVAALLLQAGAAGAQDSLAAAKQLYASASYDEALAMLDRSEVERRQRPGRGESHRAVPRLLPPGRRSPTGRRARDGVDCRRRPHIPARRRHLAAAAVGLPRRSQADAARRRSPALRQREGELRPEGVPGGGRSVRRGDAICWTRPTSSRRIRHSQISAPWPWASGTWRGPRPLRRRHRRLLPRSTLPRRPELFAACPGGAGRVRAPPGAGRSTPRTTQASPLRSRSGRTCRRGHRASRSRRSEGGGRFSTS